MIELLYKDLDIIVCVKPEGLLSTKDSSNKANMEDVLKEENPMTYAYYHKVVKGKSPKNAPTYIPEEEKKEKWVCSICKYEYDGEIPFEELPEDYKCPICKQPKSKFIKM